MLTQSEAAGIAEDLAAEAKRRTYVQRVLAPDFVDDGRAWEMLVDMMEVVLHRANFYVVSADLLAKLGTTPAALQASRNTD